MLSFLYCTLGIAVLIGPAGAAAQSRSNAGALPPAVRAAFERAYPKATIDHWAAEQREGQPVFEIESHAGRQKRDVLFTPNGRLIEFEEPVTIASLPPAVRQSVSTAFPRATIRKAERVVRGHVTEYEVFLKRAAVKEVLLSGRGVILRTR